MPPVTATLKLVDEPSQIIASPLNIDPVGEVDVVVFKGCKAETVLTKQLPQLVVLFAAPAPLSDIVVA